MAIKFIKPEEKEVKMINEMLVSSRHHNMLNESLVSNFNSRNSAGLPHKIYVIELSDLRNKKRLKGIREIGKRYLVLNRNSAYMSAEILKGQDQKEFCSLVDSPFVHDTEIAIGKIEEALEAKNDAFEFGFIKIPSILLFVIWLKGENENYFVPIGNLPQSLAKYKLYVENEFFGVAEKIASQLENLEP